VTAEVKSVNTSGVGIAPEITNHPRVVMRCVEKNMTQNVVNKVETEVGGEVVTRGIDVKKAKSASQCILSHEFPLTAIYRRKRDKSEERKARKAEKKRLRDEEEMRQVAELSIYSATDNPFHDVNLGQQFRWHKKNEREKKMGLSAAEAQCRDVARRQEAKEELERLNRRRAEREAEQRLREEEEVRMQRLAESAQMAEWVAKDGDFQLEQERRRAAIRVKEKRAKAIDFLALNLRYVNPIDDTDEDSEEAGLEIDLDEPYNILDVSSHARLRYALPQSREESLSEPGARTTR
jgi:vacuolar-type H+-ATPase subunit I/STV1